MNLKYSFDFTISLLFSVLLSPIWVLIGVLIKCESRGPIFFRQIRIGKNEKPFSIFKFRTMITDAEKKGLQITVGQRDPRITKVGFFLRKTKLDELPQLFNIVKGDMSFVGPRPEVAKYVEMYNETQKKVLSIRPGITDLASLKYINENTLLENVSDPERVYIEKIMPEKLKLNLQYIENRNFLYDIHLILKTILKIFS